MYLVYIHYQFGVGRILLMVLKLVSYAHQQGWINVRSSWGWSRRSPGARLKGRGPAAVKLSIQFQGVFDLKQRCADRSVFVIEVRRELYTNRQLCMFPILLQYFDVKHRSICSTPLSGTRNLCWRFGKNKNNTTNNISSCGRKWGLHVFFWSDSDPIGNGRSLNAHLNIQWTP